MQTDISYEIPETVELPSINLCGTFAHQCYQIPKLREMFPHIMTWKSRYDQGTYFERHLNQLYIKTILNDNHSLTVANISSITANWQNAVFAIDTGDEWSNP